MKGSILFNSDINIEVDVDPSAEEGARLVSAKNLVDGQELGGGGGDDFSIVEVTINISNESAYADVSAAILESNQSASIAHCVNATNVVEILLYKGAALINIDCDEITSHSGDAEASGIDWIITGDATFNVVGIEDI